MTAILKQYQVSSLWYRKSWNTVTKTVDTFQIPGTAIAMSHNVNYVLDIYQIGFSIRRVYHDGNGGVTFVDVNAVQLLKTTYTVAIPTFNLTEYRYNKTTRLVETTVHLTDEQTNFSLSTIFVVDTYCIAGGSLREVYHDGNGGVSNTDIVNHPLCITADPYLKVSIMGALRFVNFPEDQIIGSCNTYETLDNVLYNGKQIFNILNPNYYPKIQKCDTLKFQFRSNFDTNIVTVKEARTGNAIQTIYPTIEVQNTKVIDDNLGYIIDNGGGKCRVYFNGDMPLYIKQGDFFKTVNSSINTFDGDFLVDSIGYDAGVLKNYLVIVKTYTGSQTRVKTTIKTYSNAGVYNVYEFSVNFGTYNDGYYQINIDTSDINIGSINSKSEIFNVKANHPNTLMIKYKNNDNAFDIDYTTGIINQMRVEAFLWKLKPASEKKVLRDCDKLKIISASPFRKVQFETFWLPPYMHEKLAFIFLHDYVELNGVEFSGGEESYDIVFANRYGLQTGSILLEQGSLFDNDNSDDLGSVDNANGFIIANNGFLKR